MKSRRLGLLLAVLMLLAVVRVVFPPTGDDRMSTAVAWPVPSVDRGPPRAPVERPPVDLVAAADSEDETDMPGNAFAVRPVPAPVLPAPIPSVARVVIAAPVEPPVPVAPPPPLQVVGTFDDGTTPAVFVATSRGTLLARAGTVLLSEYKVTAITPQQITVVQLSTQKATNLPIAGRATP